MPDSFIYDHVRTLRGRGKPDGALHEVTTLNLATQALVAIRERNKLDPALVDDVVLGCVDPVGEAGGDIARVAAICADYGNGVPGVQINRFCASGLDAVNFAAAQVMSGQHGLAEVAERIAPGAVHVRRVVAVLDGHHPPAAPRELARERHCQRRLSCVLPADHGDDPHGQSASARARSSAVLMLKKSRAGSPSRRTASSGSRPTRTARWNPIARRSPASRLAVIAAAQAGP